MKIRYEKKLVLCKPFTYYGTGGETTMGRGTVIWKYKGKYDMLPPQNWEEKGWQFWLGHGWDELIPADHLKLVEKKFEIIEKEIK